MNKNSINSFDFRDRIVIDKSKINGKINVGDYIFKNSSGSYIITTKRRCFSYNIMYRCR